MSTPDLPAAVDLMRPYFSDAPGSTEGLAALEVRDLGESLLREWCDKHLTWEKLARPPILDVEAQLGATTSLRGLVGCVRGELRLLSAAADDDHIDGRAFLLRDDKQHISGGWIVGSHLRVDSPGPAVVCGVIVGRHGVNGLRIVGLLEGAIPADRGTSSGHAAPPRADDRDAGARDGGAPPTPKIWL